MSLQRIASALAASFLLLAACSRSAEPPKPPITVFAAASLARPLATLSESFSRREHIASLVELGGSMEQSRKLTDLGRAPDVLMLVDDDVIAALVPAHASWYVRFATNRLVIAYTPSSRHAAEVSSATWTKVLTKPDVRIGRADPTIAPAGRHALALLKRTAAYFGVRGLDDALLAQAPLRFMRPNATELAALLQSGEVDYIVDYESVARQYGFSFVELPEDLAPAVLYGLTVPRQAPHSEGAVEFVRFVLSDEGKAILRDAHVTVLQTPVGIGASMPQRLKDRVRTIAPGR